MSSVVPVKSREDFTGCADNRIVCESEPPAEPGARRSFKGMGFPRKADEMSLPIVAHDGNRVYTQIANPDHPEPRAARKFKLINAGAEALARGDWLAVAIVTAVVMSEVADD